MNTKLHAVTDAEGRPIRFYVTIGQIADYTGAAALPGSLPKAEWLLAYRGHDADWFRDALKDEEIKPCIPGRKSRGKTIKHDKRRYKRRSRIEIMFGRLKTGDVWQPATTDVTGSSPQPQHSPQSSCSGYETRTSPDANDQPGTALQTVDIQARALSRMRAPVPVNRPCASMTERPLS